jgi:surface polysaccharide O-acyltransferase-like enzyme
MHINENKEFWLNDLRAYATIAVVLLHITAPVVYKFGTVSKLDWWVGNIIDSTTRFCVPIFLMLTGALILPKKYELGDFLKKRILRILPPFLFWSIIYILYNFPSEYPKGVDLTIIGSIKYIIMSFKNGASYHLWYVYMIIGIYLFIPIISKWIINSTKNEITYYVLIWFIVILINLPFFIKSKPNIDLTYFSGFLGYPILGYLLTVKIPDNKLKLYPHLSFILGTSITIIGTYLLTKNKGQFISDFYSFLSPNVIIASIGIFLFFKQSNFKNRFLTAMTNFISTYSYGIYLAHIFVLNLLLKVGISWTFINPIIGILLTTLLCLTISSIIIYIINKIPYGRYISG